MTKINIYAKSTLPILAASVFVVLLLGTTQNNVELINFGKQLFNTLIVGVVLVTAIRSDSKKSRKWFTSRNIYLIREAKAKATEAKAEAKRQ